jgi:hypothetical protein
VVVWCRGGHRFGSVRFRSQTTEPDEPTVQISRPISNHLNVRFSRFLGSPVRSVTVRFSWFGSYIKFFGPIQLLYVTFQFFVSFLSKIHSFFVLFPDLQTCNTFLGIILFSLSHFVQNSFYFSYSGFLTCYRLFFLVNSFYTPLD